MNSDNVKISMEHNRDFKLAEFDENLFGNNDKTNARIDSILKMIHARIEEKYRDFRSAFRAIDLDFGG